MTPLKKGLSGMKSKSQKSEKSKATWVMKSPPLVVSDLVVVGVGTLSGHTLTG